MGRHAAVCGIVLLLVSACTSVHQVALQAGPGGSVASGAGGVSVGASSGATLPGADAADAGDGQGQGTSGSRSAIAGSGGPAGSAVETASGSSSPSSGGAGGGPTGAAAPGAGSGSSAAGGCKGSVKLGFSYSSDEQIGLAAVGNPAEAASFGNYAEQQQATIQRAVTDLNHHGGLAGCTVVPVYYDFHSLGVDGFSGESQTECVTFAEDDHVFAVITGALENKTLIACLAQHHVPVFFNSSSYNPTGQDFADYRGYLYQTEGINPWRWAPFIQMYASAGFFGPGAKVGILLADDGYGTNDYLVNHIWKPELAAMGITPVVFTFPQIESYTNVSSVTTELAAAVLQFKSDGVNRVLTTPDGGDAVIFFTQVANSQSYDPRYGLSTLSGVAAWSSEPTSQQPGAVAISFNLVDLGSPTTAELNGLPANPDRTACNNLFNGQLGGSSIVNFYGLCDDLDFLGAALHGQPAATPATLLAGGAALGDGLSLAGGYGNATFTPTKQDGGSVARTMVFDVATQQFNFVGPPVAIP
jgi:ABC-type branched-subunit amino acid transport system substrate-binding protein